MFSGIIEEVGEVRSIRPKLTIEAKVVLEGSNPGDSIAVNGICLSIIALDDNSFSTETMPETMRRTNLGSLHPGDPVNLERGLRMGARIGGHLVQGHVDCIGRVASLSPEGRAILMDISPPDRIMDYIVEKGFVALDGASLTVTSCERGSFIVSLAPFTLAHTALGQRRTDDEVNVEVDIIGKYVESFLHRRGGVTEDLLSKHGFL